LFREGCSCAVTSDGRPGFRRNCARRHLRTKGSIHHHGSSSRHHPHSLAKKNRPLLLRRPEKNHPTRRIARDGWVN
jgi:hypothetical protein